MTHAWQVQKHLAGNKQLKRTGKLNDTQENKLKFISVQCVKSDNSLKFCLLELNAEFLLVLSTFFFYGRHFYQGFTHEINLPLNISTRQLAWYSKIYVNVADQSISKQWRTNFRNHQSWTKNCNKNSDVAQWRKPLTTDRYQNNMIVTFLKSSCSGYEKTWFWSSKSC